MLYSGLLITLYDKELFQLGLAHTEVLNLQNIIIDLITTLAETCCASVLLYTQERSSMSSEWLAE